MLGACAGLAFARYSYEYPANILKHRDLPASTAATWGAFGSFYDRLVVSRLHMMRAGLACTEGAGGFPDGIGRRVSYRLIGTDWQRSDQYAEDMSSTVGATLPREIQWMRFQLSA